TTNVTFSAGSTGSVVLSVSVTNASTCVAGGSHPGPIVKGDFNANAMTDLVWRNTSTAQSLVWFLNGTTFTGFANFIMPPDVNWQLAGVADFNGDGQMDLLWHRNTGENVVWFMNGTTY